MTGRFVVVVARIDVAGDGDIVTDVVLLGPFRREERAEARAATVRRLAAKYDETPGTLHVHVEPLHVGSTGAQEAMDAVRSDRVIRRPAATLDQVVTVIRGHRFRHATEDELQEGLAEALAGAGYRVEREARLTPRDRIDLLVDTIGVEVKVAGVPRDVERQLSRCERAHTIIRVLDRDALGSREEFVREWGKELGRGKVGVRDPRALGHHLRDQGLHIRRTRADVGEETPGVDRIAHEVDVDRKTMDRLMEDVLDIAELIVAGGDRKEVFLARGDIDWQMRRATGLAKAPYVAAFVKLLLESEEKVVLWGWHRDVYELWTQKLAEFEPALYTGSESPRQKALSAARFVGGEELQRFTDEDRRAGRIGPWEPGHQESRVLVMSLRSGAGLDGLQEVCNVGVFGELDWSPAQHDQCIGRLDRDGQEHRVLAYYLHTPDGSDPTVLETLGIKREQGELIRDPTLPLLEQGNDLTDRPRRLAEEALRRRKIHPRQAVLV